MTLYPILEPIESTNPDRLIQDFSFWREIRSTDAIFQHPEGAPLAAIKEFGGVSEAVACLAPHFEHLSIDQISLTLSAASFLLSAGLVAAAILDKALSKKPLADFAREDVLLDYLTQQINEPDAFERFQRGTCDHDRETEKVLAAIANHLDGRPSEAVAALRRTIGKFSTDPKLESLLRMRLGKALSASGQLEKGEEEYDWVSKNADYVDLKAKAKRELLNTSVQKAWTYYQEKNAPELCRLREYIKKLADEIQDHLASDEFDPENKGKFTASLSEFRAYNRALDPALHKADQKACLSEIEISVEELTREDATTGTNRRTQAAALMIRWHDPERGLAYLQARSPELKGSLERAAAGLVEGQAHCMLDNPEGALGAFRKSEEEVKGKEDDRFWRDARRLRLSVEEFPSPLLWFGPFARGWTSGDRFNRSFVIL